MYSRINLLPLIQFCWFSSLLEDIRKTLRCSPYPSSYFSARLPIPNSQLIPPESRKWSWGYRSLTISKKSFLLSWRIESRARHVLNFRFLRGAVQGRAFILTDPWNPGHSHSDDVLGQFGWFSCSSRTMELLAGITNICYQQPRSTDMRSLEAIRRALTSSPFHTWGRGTMCEKVWECMLNVCKVGPNLRPPGLFLLLYGNSFWAGIQQGLRYIQRGALV